LLRKQWVRQGWGRRRVLIVGLGDIARMILQKLLWMPELGYDVVGLVAPQDQEDDSVLGTPVVGSVTHLGSIIQQQQANEVIIALPEETAHSDLLWLISECERGRVTIRVLP
jgi:FlaA1/EpsC-like NDP-sugar epimerase